MIKARLWSKVVESLRDLNIEAKGKIVRVKKVEESILIKAEVIGVKGIVCLENECLKESEVPVKKISKDEWKKLG